MNNGTTDLQDYINNFYSKEIEIDSYLHRELLFEEQLSMQIGKYILFDCIQEEIYFQNI